MSNTKRFCYSCDLKDDKELIEEYKAHHAPGSVPKEIIESIKDAGVVAMEIYLTGNRMFMIMEVDETFDPIKKAEMDANNPAVQNWEKLMWKFQQALPWANKGEKWISLDKIFKLD
ncbi:L-rhamnose mutarotase [Flavobacteriaceae bacterium MAR_2009_75]|nr:L-rhamnose mutarotase [Flavobacteriaceae bacterium MAR_2009_75]